MQCVIIFFQLQKITNHEIMPKNTEFFTANKSYYFLHDRFLFKKKTVQIGIFWFISFQRNQYLLFMSAKHVFIHRNLWRLWGHLVDDLCFVILKFKLYKKYNKLTFVTYQLSRVLWRKFLMRSKLDLGCGVLSLWLKTPKINYYSYWNV